MKVTMYTDGACKGNPGPDFNSLKAYDPHHDSHHIVAVEVPDRLQTVIKFSINEQEKQARVL